MKRGMGGKNKSPRYKGNGKFGYQYQIGMPTRELTDDEKLVEAELHKKYDDILGDFSMVAGKNKGKTLWLVKIYDGREVESYQGPHELDKELERWLIRVYPEIAARFEIGG